MEKTRINIISGFLGAGKTTLIRKLIAECFQNEHIVLIENEFGQIGIDGGFLRDSGIQIKEINFGCICCSLVGDFGKALENVMKEYAPSRILIEPFGVGKLSEIIRAVQRLENPDIEIESIATVIDISKYRVYLKNFEEFYRDQIKHANCLILSHIKGIPASKVEECVYGLHTLNAEATIITTDWAQLSGMQIMDAMEHKLTLTEELHSMRVLEKHCCCGQHPDHVHHHDCNHHKHNHEQTHCHHHVDDVFSSWGIETNRIYTASEISATMDAFKNFTEYGIILRAKGFLPGENGEWVYFDYVPGESDIRIGNPNVTGRICVIGHHLQQEKLKKLFRAS